MTGSQRDLAAGTQSAPLRLAAPAKLNLYLHITGRRADGYHLLDSLIAFADIADIVEIAPAEALSLTVEGPFAGGLDGGPGDNLVIKAAERMGQLAGRSPAFAIRLVKRLPVASGIGGGSADAAATIRGIAQLWGLDPRDRAVVGVAASLGADTPACLDGQAGFVGDIGTEWSACPSLPEASLVLANPGIPLATPAVYRARTGPFRPPDRFSEAPGNAERLATLLRARENDLAAAAIGLVPEIAEVLNRLGADPTCLLARMSGSGATCFALYPDRASAAHAAATLATREPGWWVAAGRLLGDIRAL